jgi:hypothetical protein
MVLQMLLSGLNLLGVLVQPLASLWSCSYRYFHARRFLCGDFEIYVYAPYYTI